MAVARGNHSENDGGDMTGGEDAQPLVGEGGEGEGGRNEGEEEGKRRNRRGSGRRRNEEEGDEAGEE